MLQLLSEDSILILLIMNKQRIKSNSRGIYFGIMINPKVDVVEKIDWKSLDKKSVIEKLTTLDFPSRNELTSKLNRLVVINLSGNETGIEYFTGQFELGGDSKIPHYQLAIQMKTICRKKQVLNASKAFINGHINVDIQYHYEEMKKYCTKEQEFLSEDYSGQIHKKLWKIDYRSKRPNLKKVIENPYPWQKLLKDQVLSNKPEDRIVDWLVDPVGNTGKSSFARAYCSDENSEAILMKIDNLDRMELSLINKISNYRDQYYKDPKIIFFDFPRASSMTQVMQATALMEDTKSGYLETNFGGKHKNIKICNVHVVVLANTAPDLSVLSVDRWRLWRLGGEDYGNIIWPWKTIPYLKKYNKSNKSSLWCIKVTNYLPSDIVSMKQFKDVKLPTDWFNTCHKTDDHAEVFGVSTQYTNDVCSLPLETPNYIRILEFRFLENMNNKNIITFNNYS